MCDRPGCIRAQRDELRDKVAELEKDALAAFDAAVSAELPGVSHVHYDSNEICAWFAAGLRTRLAAMKG